LENDSAFAKAYIGLASIYYYRHSFDKYLSENYLDSVLILSDRALSFDDHLSDGYFFRGQYYLAIGNTDQTIKEWERALRYNPNDWNLYSDLGYMIYILDTRHADYVKGLQYLYKALSLNHGKERTWFLRRMLGDTYGIFAGFPEKYKYYYEEAFKLDNDSSNLVRFNSDEDRFESLKKDYTSDSNNVEVIRNMAISYFDRGQYKESLKYIKKIETRVDETESLFYFFRKQIGYIYLKNGFKKEAEKWFNNQKNFSEESLRKGRFYSFEGYLDLAQAYALLGDKEKAVENLRMLNKIRVCPYWMSQAIKGLPYFDSISNDPEVRQILSDLEAKYQAEHERVRKWLEEKGEM
jgi:tetratricopeptide (TPR) repeat protein